MKHHRWHQIKSNQIRFNYLESNQNKSSRINLNQIKSNDMRSNQIREACDTFPKERRKSVLRLNLELNFKCKLKFCINHLLDRQTDSNSHWSSDTALDPGPWTLDSRVIARTVHSLWEMSVQSDVRYVLFYFQYVKKKVSIPTNLFGIEF